MPSFLAALLAAVAAGTPPVHWLLSAETGPVVRGYRWLDEEYDLSRLPVGWTSGTVEAVTAGTVTLRARSGFCRTFEASVELASDTTPRDRTSAWGYRLNQVRVGDTIAGVVSPTRRGYVLISLEILRRPRGLVPPSDVDAHLPPRFRMHVVNIKHQLVDGVSEMSPWVGRRLYRLLW